jgi:hypothetical protein
VNYIKSVKKLKKWDGFNYLDGTVGSYLMIDTNDRRSSVPIDPANTDYQDILELHDLDL